MTKDEWLFFRKPLLDGQSKELLDKAGVQQEYYLECLYGENIDKFRELVTLVAVQNKESEDNVKSILSNNRRRVKNRGSARRSRVSKNDHLQNLREQLVKRRKHLARVLHYIKRNQVWNRKDQYSNENIKKSLETIIR